MKEAAAFPEKRSDVYPEKSSVENRRDEQGCRKKRWNRRKTTIVFLIVAIGFLTAVCIGGFFCKEAAQATDFSRKNLPPCLSYPFGTDWLEEICLPEQSEGFLSALLSESVLLHSVQLWHLSWELFRQQ